MATAEIRERPVPGLLAIAIRSHGPEPRLGRRTTAKTPPQRGTSDRIAFELRPLITDLQEIAARGEAGLGETSCGVEFGILRLGSNARSPQ